VGIEMPAFVDAAKVAARMSFFGPLSLGLFFSVLVIAAIRMGIFLHVAHFGLLAAACFAFQLLFAYSVDVLPAVLAFVVASAVTIGLVGFYLHLIAGKTFMRIAMVAQAAYIVLFNATFFFDGYTGLTLTIVGIITLGLVMAGTAKMDWSKVMDFGPDKNPPPLPAV
jgi:inner membrane protein involved in colicin E2 resistance